MVDNGIGNHPCLSVSPADEDNDDEENEHIFRKNQPNDDADTDNAVAVGSKWTNNCKF